MPATRSGSLAAWACAWLGAQVSIERVVGAVTGSDAPHRVGGLTVFDRELVPLRELLVTWRHAGGAIRAVLPVPGDVRGLPGPVELRSAALVCGAAVVGPGLAVVPEVTKYAPSSAPATVVWRAFGCEPPPPDHQSVDEAQYDLTTAIRESATALAAADVARRADVAADPLHVARQAGERLNLPPGFPPRAVALLAQAERLQAVLDVAFADPTGGAIDRIGIAARVDALRPLATAVRRARVTGYNALS